jgi:hypothetical protein
LAVRAKANIPLSSLAFATPTPGSARGVRMGAFDVQVLDPGAEVICARRQRVALSESYVHTAYLRGLRPRRAAVLRVAKEFVVMLPVALDFAHDALEFGIPAQVLPVLVALEPRKIMISKLNGSFQPGESWLLLSQ